MQCKDLSPEHEQILRPFPSLFLHPLPLVVSLSQKVGRPTSEENKDQIDKAQILVEYYMLSIPIQYRLIGMKIFLEGFL